MRKVVFISKNYMLIERITAFVNAQEEKQFLLFSTTRNEMVLEDVEDFDANIVLIDDDNGI